MRVVHLSVHDLAGGAGRAAHRLHTGLLSAGAESIMLVRDSKSGAAGVVEQRSTLKRILARNRAYVDQAFPLLYRRRDRGCFFSSAIVPDGLTSEIRQLRPDVLNVHWIGEGFARPQTLTALGIPIVWTMHDSWAFTGGCHVPNACLRYIERCGACPLLGSNNSWDLSRLGWSKKHVAYRRLDLTVVTPSRWLAECSGASSLLHGRRIEVIPNGIDTSAFRPIPSEVARSVLRLPPDARLVLFVAAGGAADPNKGYRFLADALRSLAGAGQAAGVQLVVAGAASVPDAASLGVPVHCFGNLSDDTSMALLCSAADVSVVPSVQENFANTGLEALACGTPVVAFRVGGMPEMVRHEVNGVIVEPFDVDALARAVRWTLEDDARRAALSRAARQIVEREYGLQIQARRYAELYEHVIGHAARFEGGSAHAYRADPAGRGEG